MRQFKIVLVFLIVFVFSGCVNFINEYEDSYKFKYQHSTATTDFTKLTKVLTDELSATLLLVSKNKPVYVTDFVNLDKLDNHSELGFMLSDEVKSLVTKNNNIYVQAIEYSKFLKLGDNGTKLLSRKHDEIKTKQLVGDRYALVGTYAFTQRQLILYLKLIQLSTGVILKSATSATELTDEIIHFEKKVKYKRNNPNIYTPVVL